MASKTAITIKHKDGTEVDYMVSRFPWQYKTFTVLDEGAGALVYVPSENIEGIEVRSEYSQAVTA